MTTQMPAAKCHGCGKPWPGEFRPGEYGPECSECAAVSAEAHVGKLSKATAVTASAVFHGRRITMIETVNPGGWFGKTWLLEIAIGHWPRYFAVEADCAIDAIDELADHAKYGKEIRVEDPDLKDYPEESRSYAGNAGHVVDIDSLLIHGADSPGRGGVPFPMRYHLPGSINPNGIDPDKYGTDPDDDE
jgi:hypothetical protein